MPVLTDLASAEIKRTTKVLYGKTLTRPEMLVTDGASALYAVDVEIAQTDPSGRIKQYLNDKKKKDEDPDNDLITGIPGQRPEDWQLDDSLPGHVDTTLRNVPLARNNAELIYADIGSPVVCNRSESGQWQVTGFSSERPGTHHLYPVNLGNMTLGTVIDLSIDTRLLTLAELGELGPFGYLPFGASAIFQGGAMIRIA